MKANYTHIDLWYGMGDRIFVWDYHTIIKRPIWFGEKWPHEPRGNAGNSGSMEHPAGIFGFIGLHMWCEEGFSHWIQSCRNLLHGSAMVVSPMFCRLESPFCREPRIPSPEFCWVNHVQHWGLPFPHFLGHGFGRCHASFRGFWIPFRRFFHGDSGSPKSP